MQVKRKAKFHEICASLCGSNNLLTFYQIINKKPDFPSIADEIAESRPDMNIKVAALTVTQKLYYTLTFVLLNKFIIGLTQAFAILLPMHRTLFQIKMHSYLFGLEV